MKTLVRNIAWIALVAAALLVGFWTAKFWYAPFAPKKVTEDSSVLLERIKTVAKLVTVEGYFSEVYNYKDYWKYDLPFLRKKALLRVKAKVSVGYDLEQLRITTQPEARRLLISNLPKPEIISIDHTIDYYDISEGTFNSFSEEDYNRLNADAKKMIETKALESDLLSRAEAQGNDLLEVIRFMAESAGWTVVMEGEEGGYKN